MKALLYRDKQNKEFLTKKPLHTNLPIGKQKKSNLRGWVGWLTNNRKKISKISMQKQLKIQKDK